jgi:hypothetical protein
MTPIPSHLMARCLPALALPWLALLATIALALGCDGAADDTATDATVSDASTDATPPGSDPDDGIPPADMPLPAGACDPIETFFTQRIWAGFMSTTCVGCHIEGGAAAASRLHLVTRLDDGGLDHNLNQLAPLAAEHVGALSLLVAKPTGRHPNSHGGGALLRPDGEEAAALAWLARRLEARHQGTLDPCDSGEIPGLDDPAQNCLAPGPRALRRLSHVEYGNTLHALLGVDIDVRAALTPDEVVDGFDNHRDALDVPDLLADQYRSLAEEAAAETADLNPLACPAPSPPATAPALAPSSPTSAAAPCAAPSPPMTSIATSPSTTSSRPTMASKPRSAG